MNYRKMTAVIAGTVFLLSAPAATTFADEITYDSDTAIGGITLLLDEGSAQSAFSV